MSNVIGMHFVCKDDLNIVDHGDGTFDTGFGKVALKHCHSVEYVALHQRTALPTARRGPLLEDDYLQRGHTRHLHGARRPETQGPAGRWQRLKGYRWS